MRIAVFTHVIHQFKEGRYFAYPPYVREMNLWFKILNSEFRIKNLELEVEVVAPSDQKEEIQGELSYDISEMTFTKTPSFNLLSIREVLLAVLKIPLISYRILKAMRRADYLHLRCPGNIGLIATFCQILFPNKPKTAKYAGNWDPDAKQPWTYKLQRWVLGNPFLTRNMTVLVYGAWPGQSKNVRSFFTASFSERTVLRAQEKDFQKPYIFLFVGNLVPGKGLKIALRMLQNLQERGIDCRLEIYGEGPEKIPMESYVGRAGIKNIEFKGNRSLEELEKAYQRGHFVILPSRSEGWPKAVAEGMFFGCIPVVTPVSCVPWMLNPPVPPLGGGGEYSVPIICERGILIDGDLDKDVELILQVLRDKERMQRMSTAAKEWSQEYTLERFEEGIRNVLEV